MTDSTVALYLSTFAHLIITLCKTAVLIAYLTGKITFKKPAYIYVECGGVGYHVNISLNTYQAIEDKEDSEDANIHAGQGRWAGAVRVL